jgi:hypothetical protein
MNAVTTGRWSKRLAALDALGDASPALPGLTPRDRRRLDTIAYGLQCYADILLMLAHDRPAGELRVLQHLRRSLNPADARDAAGDRP